MKPWYRRVFGTRSERAAARFLKGRGQRVLARNVRLPQGELDMVTLDGECIVFVEVRSTEEEQIDRPAESVDAEKQRQLTKLALAYLQKHKLLGRPARFDVVAVRWPAGSREPVIEHHEHAFPAMGRFQMYT